MDIAGGDLGGEAWRRDVDATADVIGAFLARTSAGEGRVVTQTPAGEILQRLGADALLAGGGLGGETLTAFLQELLVHATALHHPANMGHQSAPPNRAASLAGFVDSAVNNPMNIYEMGPSFAALELAVLNWMLSRVGWAPMPVPPSGPAGPHGGGVLTHGGSAANLTALAAARAAAAPAAWRDGGDGRLVVLAPPAAHYSIERACGVLGIGTANMRPLPGDGLERIRPEAVTGEIDRARSEGRTVMAVVANACATAAGLYDPLGEIAAACREAGVWLHVDGAHGAAALLSARHRDLMEGVQLADSMIWDAHKMMRTPSVCAAVLVRDHATLDRAFIQNASYIFHEKEQPGVDFINRSLECTKSALGLRAFCAVAEQGEAGLAGYVARQYDLAAEAADLIEAAPDFEIATRPESNIVLFNHTGDVAPLRLREQLLSRGRFYITTAEFAGRRWLRLTFMSPQTSLDDVRALLEELHLIAREAGRAAS